MESIVLGNNNLKLGLGLGHIYMQKLPLISHVIVQSQERKNAYRMGSVGPHPVHKQTITPLLAVVNDVVPTYYDKIEEHQIQQLTDRLLLACMYLHFFLLAHSDMGMRISSNFAPPATNISRISSALPRAGK